MQFRCVEDFRGMGRWRGIFAVNAYEGQDVLIWSWASAMDGPIPEDVEELVNTIARYSGGWQEAPLVQ